MLRIEDGVELLLGHKALLEHDVVDRAVGFKGFLGHLGALLVAYVGVEGGDDANAVSHHLGGVLGIDGDALDALLGEGVDGIAQPGHALDDRLGDDGLHHVELELAGLGGKGYGSIVAYHLEAHLVGHLGYHGVHLARHD